MAQLSAGNLIHDVGYMESGLTCSYEMIVLTDELVSMTNNLMKAIDTSTDSLMLDEIDRVGPGGHFLNTDQTLNRFRDFWYPTLLDRSIRSTWLRKGATTLGNRLNAKVKEIIKDHKPEPMNKSVVKQVNEILSRAS
jgi:trimethylamine---corrinoid protein Co-methyltransferase